MFEDNRLHGVARDGTTEFPKPVGLGATFDSDAIHRMAIVIGSIIASSPRPSTTRFIAVLKGRTYRYFEGTPLYPFGYGLSYTTFSYSDLTLATSAIAAGQPLTAEVAVTNTDKRAGDEVAQLYLSFPDVAGAPIRALRIFQRVHLEPGQSQKVHFDLKPRDLSMVLEAGEPVIPEGRYSVSVGGRQPNTGAPTVAGTFEVEGSIVLPE